MPGVRSAGEDTGSYEDLWCVSSRNFITASNSEGVSTFLAFKRAGTSDSFAISEERGEEGELSAEMRRQYKELASPDP